MTSLNSLLVGPVARLPWRVPSAACLPVSRTILVEMLAQALRASNATTCIRVTRVQSVVPSASIGGVTYPAWKTRLYPVWRRKDRCEGGRSIISSPNRSESSATVVAAMKSASRVASSRAASSPRAVFAVLRFWQMLLRRDVANESSTRSRSQAELADRARPNHVGVPTTAIARLF